MGEPSTVKTESKQPSTPVPNRDLSLWVSPDLWTKHRDKFEPGDLIEFRREGKLFQHWGLYLGEDLVVHVSSFDLWQPFAGFGDRFVNISQASTGSSVSAISAAQAAETVSIELQEMAADVCGGVSAAVEQAVEPAACVHCEDLVVEASPLDLGYNLEDRTKWFIKVENILRIAGKDQFRVNNVAHRTYKRVARTPKEIFQLVKCFKDKEVDYSLVSSNCEHFCTSLKFKTDAKEREDPDVVPVVMTPCGTSSQVRRVVTGISMALVAVAGLAGAAVVSLLTQKPEQIKNDAPGPAKKPKLPEPTMLSS